MHEEEIDNLTNDLMEKGSEMNQCLLDFDHEMSLKD